MIRLHPFKLTSEKYFRILVYNRFRKYWWLYLIMIAIAIFYIPRFQENEFNKFIVIFAFLYPIFIIVWLYIFANSKKNKNVFLESNYSFNDDEISIETDSSSSSIPFSSIIEYKNYKEYLMLYISKGQFLYVPKAAFMKQEDEKKFLDLIIHAIH